MIKRSANSVGTQTIAVASGKGGVGKTLTTVNIAAAMRRNGQRVLIFDGDLGLANVNVVLGLTPRFNIRSVLDGHATLRDIIVPGPLGVDVVPSGSGIAELTRLSSIQKQSLFDHLAGVMDDYDVVIIDTAAGIGSSVIHFCLAADDILIVTTPEPHAITDAYAMIKVLCLDHGISSVKLLVNQTRSSEEGLRVGARVAEVARRCLNVSVRQVGNVPLDPQVTKAVLQRRAASEESTHTIAGQAWAAAARELESSPSQRRKHGNLKDFWQTLLASTPPQVSASR